MVPPTFGKLGKGKTVREVLAAVVAVLMLAVSCGSGGSVAADSGAVATGAALASFEPELQALGDLTRSAGPPITTIFDAQPGELDLDGGIMLRVPAGAFSEPTEVTVELLDLQFENYLENAPTGSVYVVSTVDDVALATPVLLEIPQPSADVTVTQFRDGEWRSVDVPDGDTTIVPIIHFSTVSTAVVSRVQATVAALDAAMPQSTDATFLVGCIAAANRMLGGEIDDTLYNPASADERSTAELAGHLSLSVCTSALIDRVTPRGQRVTTQCVGNQIDADTDFRQAIAECLIAQDEPEPGEAETVEDEPAAEVPDAAPAEPTGPVSFAGSSTVGAIANGPSDDLISADFTATIDGSTVTMDVTLVIHYWHRGGPEEVHVDQNCGTTYQHALHFEGPAGNPTTLVPVVDSSEILEIQGVLCDEDDAERELLEVGGTAGAFKGKANGLGIDGTLSVGFFRELAISSG